MSSSSQRRSVGVHRTLSRDYAGERGRERERGREGEREGRESERRGKEGEDAFIEDGFKAFTNTIMSSKSFFVVLIIFAETTQQRG